tara:strand:- start:151 stop:345 length:195 start_codon:yes stop_codon:yes gene_type:complete
MDERKYCVATCHQGTDFGIFLSGPDDERLTMEEANQLGDEGKFMFDCTAEQYWKSEREALDKGL